MEFLWFYPTKTSPLSIHSCIFDILYLHFATMRNLLKKRKVRRAITTRLIAPHITTESPWGYSNAKLSKMVDLGDQVKMFQNEGKKMRNWSTSTTTILNMFSAKNSLKEDWNVGRLSGLTYIILAKFSLKPALLGILTAYKTYLLQGSRVCSMEI